MNIWHSRLISIGVRGHKFLSCRLKPSFNILCLCLTLLSFWSSIALSAEKDLSIPSLLEPWVDWVESANQTKDCHQFWPHASQASNTITTPTPFCAWPEKLNIQVTEEGAEFNQSWELTKQDLIELPGSLEHWPQQVEVNDNPHVVIQREGKPAIVLAAGQHKIHGKFLWKARPESISIPTHTSIIDLTINGKSVPRPAINEDMKLWLGETTDSYVEEDGINIRVGREIQDELPMMMRIVIEADIYGKVREESIGPIIPEGFELASVKSDLTIKITADGYLEWQLRPGTSSVVIMLRAIETHNEIHTPAIPAPWPSEEVWTFIPNHFLRSVRVESANLIDSSQAWIPAGFDTRHPLYLMQPSDTIKLVELSRGISQFTNTIHLQREAWLSFDSEILNHKDNITGRMEKDWRLDALAPYEIQYAYAHNSALPTQIQLITQNPLVQAGNINSGFEWRTHDLNLFAHTRADFQHRLPMSAWNQELNYLDTELHLPPAHLLLHADGFDYVLGSWLSHWNILQVFLVILATVCVYHLLSWRYAIASVILLITASYEPYAPHFLIISTTIFLLLKGWTSNTKAQSFLKPFVLISAILLFVQFLAFAFIQLQSAIYPQLEPREQYSGYLAQAYLPKTVTSKSNDPNFSSKSTFNHPEKRARDTNAPLLAEEPLDRVEVTASSINRFAGLTPFDPTAHLQAGVGIPQWKWHRYRLMRNGPILINEDQSLYVLYPWQRISWRILSVIAGLILLYGFGQKLLKYPRNKKLLISKLFIFIVLLPGITHANSIPSQELLSELSQRLNPTPSCAPVCAHIAKLDISSGSSEDKLVLEAEVHSASKTSIQLPGSGDKQSWTILDLRINGVIAPSYQLDGETHVPVSMGIHQLRLEINAFELDEINLQFKDKPTQISVDLNNWQHVGVVDQQLKSNTLILNRELKHNTIAKDETKLDYRINPYFEVQRTINIDLVPTTYNRVSLVNPPQGPAEASIPLLKDEKVNYSPSSLKVDTHISLLIEYEYTDWGGTLPLQDHYEFIAHDMRNHSETWLFIVSPVLHATFNGIPQSDSTYNNDPSAAYYYYYRPQEGEKLSLDIVRPTAETGNTIAIQRANRHINLGREHRDTQLQLYLNVSQPGHFGIDLPAQAELKAVHSGSKKLPLSAIDGHLEIPVVPGMQQLELVWREAAKRTWHLNAPAYALPLAVTNSSTSIQPAENRWVIWTYGTGIGPAVQFWSLLAILIVTATILSRISRSPLGFLQWLLLGLGFSTVSSWSFLWIVAVFFVLQYRSTHSPNFEHRWRTIFIQLSLILYCAFSLLVLTNTVMDGLLSQPEMHIQNPLTKQSVVAWIDFNQHHPFTWFSDATAGELQASGIFTAPMWLYRLAMLMWSLWLAHHLVGWLRWGWAAINHGGFWPPKPKAKVEAEQDTQNVDNNQNSTEIPNDRDGS